MGSGHSCFYLRASDLTAHYEACMFFLSITLMLFNSVFYIRNSEREDRSNDRALAVTESQAEGPWTVQYTKHDCLKVLWGPSPACRQCPSWRLSWGVCVEGLSPVSASCGTNGFLPVGGAPEPSFQWVSQAPRCCIQPPQTTAADSWHLNPHVLGPSGLIISLHARLCLYLPYKKEEQQGGGDLPGIHSHTTCPS